MPTAYTTDSYVKIWYTTAYATHSHTIPTRAIETTGLGDSGNIENWDGSTQAVAAMVITLMDKLIEIVPASTTYSRFTLYKWQPTELYYAPFYEESYGGAGTGAGLTGNAKAVQATVSIRTAGFSLLKLVFLDRPRANYFGNTAPVPIDYTEVVAELTSGANGWSGRDGTKPMFGTNESISLNKRLRRKYGMI